MSEHISNTAIWGDGAGSTFRATADAIHEGIVDFEIGMVITTDENAGILDHVAEVNDRYDMAIKPVVVEGRQGRRQSIETQEHILELLRSEKIDNLTLMGALVFMGDVLVEELNGEVPEVPVARTLEEARQLLVPGSDEFGHYLPPDFPDTSAATAHFRLRNTHPAPTILTANTHGHGSHRRVIILRSAQSAQCLHVVGKDIDTGPLIAANIFPVVLPPLDANEQQIEAAIRQTEQRAQRIEKANLPLDLDKEFRDQARLRRA